MTKSVVSLAVFTSISFAGPSQAKAGFLSVINNLFASQADNQPASSDLNSQKMPLLEAPVNVDPTASSSTDPIPTSSAVAKVVTTLVAPANPSVTPPTNPDSNQISTYIVQSGDNISTIAKKFGISVNTILWANNLKKNAVLKQGQKLVILPISGVQYKVAKGDTLSSIATRFKGDLDEIMAFNNIDQGDPIKVGDIVIIPDGEMTTSNTNTSASNKLASVVQKVANATIGVSVAKADTITANTTAGYYMRPIKAGTRTQGIHGHNAVDLADSCGTPIYASAAGQVIVSKDDGSWDGGYGNYVVISHSNGSQTLYAHMQTTAVQEGDQVAQGQMIGQIGATGEVKGATGCHVHFEIRNGPVNPF